MLALGIDPGTAICGYGLVELNGSRLTAVDYGAVTTSPKARMQDRLVKLHNSIDEIIKKYRPEAVGIEELFFYRNITTAIPVAQARGVVILAAAQNDLPVIEWTPPQVKQSVTGYGKADKKQVIYMVTKLLNLKEPPTPDDTADALAVAIATLYKMDSPNYRFECN